LMQTRLALTRDLEPNHKDQDAELVREESYAQRADSGDFMETTFRSMSATIDDMERKMRQDPTGSWDEQATTLTNFRTMIADQLQVFLDNEHTQDQTEFNNRKQQHTSCGGSQRWEPGGDVATAAAEMARWRTKHQACRSSERAWLTYKTTAISSSSCASDSDVSTVHEVFAAHVTLAGLVDAAQTRAVAYDLTDPTGTRDCALDQTQFEDHFCTWRSAHYYACAATQDCTAQTGLSGMRDEMLIRSDNRRNLWRTLEILLCRVGHLLGSMDNDDSTEVSDFNTTDNCSNIALDQSKFILDLTIPSVPACSDHIAVGSTTSILVAPSMVDSAMCQQFRDANYGFSQGWEQAQHVIPSQCEATCPAISYSSWAVPAQCSNEPDDCLFYNHHRDACGSYDTAAFVAGDTCCACGGGALAIPDTIEYFVVGGGGGGGSGGGGAGGVLQGSMDGPTAPVSIVVGSGGAHGSGGAGTSLLGAAGGDSSIAGTIIAIGGGYGGGAGSQNQPGEGGSGGGGRYDMPNIHRTSGTPGQGYGGGRSNRPSYGAGGGGGGAGGTGEDAPAIHVGGRGGAGIESSFGCTTAWYAGGGGGGVNANDNVENSDRGGVGGRGGGGNGSGYGRLDGTDRFTGTHGQPNTGGGGGGTDPESSISGVGGSGIVMIKYLGPPRYTGGNTVESCGGYTVHSFLTVGTATLSPQ